MFRKKKETIDADLKINPLAIDYSKTQLELEFLNLNLERQKNITKSFLIKLGDIQLNEDSYIKDEELEAPIKDCINDVLNSLSPLYKEFLITKYFGSLEALVRFITEDISVSLTSEAISCNREKILRKFVKNKKSEIIKLNDNE